MPSATVTYLQFLFYHVWQALQSAVATGCGRFGVTSFPTKYYLKGLLPFKGTTLDKVSFKPMMKDRDSHR